ncbi:MULTISPECIES: hypothetical protein [unclassified Crossiella]|uniref:hypothetical protein n=1 Tax=unclassified Crossiella TaxID=2620835 RepID=UPI001FFE7CAE|nr:MULTISPECIES: hypothetical protein [unclassified Crossiella]MCK2238355.1 hypothetical protein [Crossiella sp. S99.2]MCK2256395.1 hypothetical protein [Crossiella sp. S99.1]
MAEQTARVPRAVKVAMWSSAVLTVAALLGSAVLREAPSASGGVSGSALSSAELRAPASSPPAGPSLRCGSGPCVEVDSATLDGVKVELLADAAGESSRVRFNEGGDSQLNVHETLAISLGGRVQKGSLTCVATSKHQSCLVTFAQSGDGSRMGTLYEKPPGRPWVRVEASYPSDLGVLQLRDVNNDGIPEVLSVETACDGNGNFQGCKRFVLRVFNHDGSFVGCTAVVNRKELLPGWPNLAPTKQQLREC